MVNVKNFVTTAIITVISLVLFLAFFVNKEQVPAVQDAALALQVFVIPLGGFALGLGAVSLAMYYTKRIVKKQQYWQYNAAALASMALVIVLGFLEADPQTAFQWYFLNVLTTLETSIWSILAFFLASAAYRGLKVRTLESTLLMVAAILVMLSNAPIGPALWGPSADIGAWIMNVPNVAGMRGLNIVVAVGIFVVALRTFMGRERSTLT